MPVAVNIILHLKTEACGSDHGPDASGVEEIETYCLRVPDVKISVMKFTFFVLLSTHEL